MLRAIAIAYDCAILLLTHPSVDGIKTGRGYSGSTHWNNAVRSRLYLTTPSKGDGDEERDEDLRELARPKANRAGRNVKLFMRWSDDCFVLEHGPPAGVLALAHAKTVFLDILRRYTAQGRNLSHQASSHATYAPKQMLDDDKGRAVGKAMLTKAMNALFDEGRIKVEQYGKASKPNSRLVEV